jgi:hypothetical protein
MENRDNSQRKRFGVPDTESSGVPVQVDFKGPSTLPAGLGSLDRRSASDYGVEKVGNQTTKHKLGVPFVAEVPESIRVVTDDACQWFPAEESEDLVPETALHEEEQGTFKDVWKSPILLSLAVFAVSVFFLFITNQVLDFVQIVGGAPAPFRVTGWIALCLLCLALCFSIFRLWWSFSRLRANPGITLLQAPKLSTNWNTWTKIKCDQAGMKAICDIIRNYPRNKTQKNLLTRGKLDFEVFTGNLDYLGRSEHLFGHDWLTECHIRYVEPLRLCANQLVHDYAKRIALKTALVRNGILDTLIVWINAVLLFEELCLVFNVRTTRFDSVVMVGKLAFTTMISAKAAELIDETSDHMIAEGQANMAEYLASVAGKYALKGVGEGSVNYFLFRRFGRAAVSVLMPIKPQPSKV